MSNKRPISIKIVSMRPEHMGAVEIIENECFEHPWTRKELDGARKKRYYISKVAIITPKGSGEKIVAGAMYLEQDKFRFTLLSLGVLKEWWRHGIGSALVDTIIKRLRNGGRYEIYELVRETNLVAQQFYRARGFVAQRPKLNAYAEDEAAYPMIYRWEWSPQGRAISGEPESCSKRAHLCTSCSECED